MALYEIVIWQIVMYVCNVSIILLFYLNYKYDIISLKCCGNKGISFALKITNTKDGDYDSNIVRNVEHSTLTVPFKGDYYGPNPAFVSD